MYQMYQVHLRKLKSQRKYTLNICKNRCLHYLADPYSNVYSGSEGPEQPVHPRSLIKVFAVRKQNDWILQNIFMESYARIRLCAYAG